ncbi:hypothetical protein [Pacificibacter marinus]|uniref:hypothetical protein n=1 Tax=Pacificibacter marinus TaxID=658057 RepID=UPI001C075269|nr:hypothetical protein [Pacificibacter marinus]MBU2865562.1 hypothetical protein [Pacificibacter marinus]
MLFTRFAFAFVLPLIACLTTPLPALAQDWSEPTRGSKVRQDLMDAIRPHAEWQLGAPVQFVVDTLRLSGDRALAFLSPKRPGGGPIDVTTVPAVLRGDWRVDGDGYLEDMDGLSIMALLVKSGDTWVAQHFSIGATDLWISAPDICADYIIVMSDFCYR